MYVTLLVGMSSPPWSLNRRCFWLVDMLRWTFKWAGDCTELLLRSLLGRDLWPKLLLERESPPSNYNKNIFSKHKQNSSLPVLLQHNKLKSSNQKCYLLNLKLYLEFSFLQDEFYHFSVLCILENVSKAKLINGQNKKLEESWQ